MTVLVDNLVQTRMIEDSVRARLQAEVYDDLAAVEALWRRLEAEPGVLATPYQRFDWVSAFVAGTLGGEAERAETVRVAVLRDPAGPVRMLLPLFCSREGGVTIARVVGATHANFHMPLFSSREAAALRGEDVAEALRAAGKAAGIDAYLLHYQPRSWDGVANPLAERGEPASSNAYGLQLGPDPETTVRRVFSADARKKLRTKEKRLVEAVGPVAFRVASCAGEAAAYLDAFYRQKASRLAAMGIGDPYAASGIRRFLAEAAGAGEKARERAAIEVCALVGQEDGRIYAVFAGAVDGRRFSGMMTSFDPDPALARFSLGEVLLQHLVRHQAAQGRRVLDLGVGEARYKANICDETIELRDVAIPVTWRGHLVTIRAVAYGRIKRRIKRNATLFGLWQRLRRLRRGAIEAPSA